MKKYLFSLTVFVVLIMLTNCQGQSGAKLLSPAEFEMQLKASPDKNIVDVRTKGEYQSGHLSNAVLIDYNKSDFKNQVMGLDKNKPVFVYCAGGGRSRGAAKVLTELGFKQVYDLKGGINAWAAAKKPVEK